MRLTGLIAPPHPPFHPDRPPNLHPSPPAATGLPPSRPGWGARPPGWVFTAWAPPGMTGVSLPTAEVMEACAAAIPNFAGVKYSKIDLVTLQECLTLRDGELDVLYG